VTVPPPRISVVIPLYNSVRWVGEMLDSVLAQTEQDFEVVVADDASSDGSAEVVIGCDDPRVRYQRHEPNIGPAANWNHAVSEARGRYVKLLCADDLLYPTSLERGAAVLDDPANAGVALVTAVHHVIDPPGRPIVERGFRKDGRVKGADAIRRMARSGTNLVGEPSAVLFRREAYLAAGPFRQQARYVLDLDMWMRLLLEGDLYVIGEPLSAFRVSGESWSNLLMAYQTSDFRDLLDYLAADPRYGVSALDVRLGHAGAWRNTQLRKLFYRLFLRRRRAKGAVRPAADAD
jgi:glycosyltransferase involved in cell wall biosynthesis